MINTIGPVWDGNEVWLLVAGGATFAAFPEWYATLFSGFYLPLLLILVALIVRGVAFEYRGKRDDATVAGAAGTWRSSSARCVPALLWGVAFANIVRGVPIDADHEYTGSFFDLLNPYALLGGLTTLPLFLTHGAMFLALKTDGDDPATGPRALARPARRWSPPWSRVVFLVWTQVDARQRSAPRCSFVLAAVAPRRRRSCAAWRGREGWAFVGTVRHASRSPSPGCSSRCSRTSCRPRPTPAYSLTDHQRRRHAYTLKVMTWVAVIFTPIVLAYQGWTYWVFRKRIGVHHIPAARAEPAARHRRSSGTSATLTRVRPSTRGCCRYAPAARRYLAVTVGRRAGRQRCW